MCSILCVFRAVRGNVALDKHFSIRILDSSGPFQGYLLTGSTI